MHRQIQEEDIVLHSAPTILTPATNNGIDTATSPTVPTHDNDEVDTQEAQDGGKRAWLGVFGSFMIFVNIWGFTFTFGTFQSYYTLDLLASDDKASPSAISWIGTIQSFLLIVGGVMTGPFYDLGAYRTMMVAGMALVLLGLFALSWSREYYQIFLSQGVCCGLGGALLYVPTLALISTSFKRQRTLAMGVVTCGVGLGGFIYVVAFQQLLPQLGFGWTVRTLAFIALGVFLLSTPNLLFKNPATVTATASSASSSSDRGRPKRKLFDKNALSNRAFQIYSVSSFFIFLGYLVPFFYIPSYAQVALRSSPVLSFWALAVSSAASILGRLIIAFAAQRIGVMAPWVFCAATSAVLCFCWIRIVTVGAFFAFCALYGFFSGALVALPPSIFPRICKDPSVLGTWLGMGWVCSGTAFLLGSPIAGALASIGVSDQDGGGALNFLPLQIFSGLMLLLGTSLLSGLWAVLLRSGERRAGSRFI